MRFMLVRRRSGDIEFGLIYGLIALLGLAAARFPMLLACAPSCAFNALTGLPCPTCGSTRAIIHLSRGELASAFRMNPLAAGAWCAALVALLCSFVTLLFGIRRIACMLSEREKDLLRISLVFALLFNWVYLLVSF